MSARLSTRLAARLFRAHVSGGAEDHAVLRVMAGDVIVGDCASRGRRPTHRRIERLRQPEVQHLHRRRPAAP